MKNYLLLPLILLLFSCGQTNETPESVSADEEENIEMPGFVQVELSDKGMPLKILVPENEIQGSDISFNSNFGRMEINYGEHFSYFIIENEANMDLKKNELESGIFTIKYLKDTPDLIIYESKLADGSSKYYHFFAIMKVGEKTYLVEDNPLREFQLDDIETMATSAVKFQAINQFTDVN